MTDVALAGSLEDQSEDVLLGSESALPATAVTLSRHGRLAKVAVAALALCTLLAGAALSHPSGVPEGSAPTDAPASQERSPWNTLSMLNGGGDQASFPAPAVAYEGGGLLALSNYMGLTAALLNVTGRPVDDLFSKFGTWSSNSGGTWFSTEIIYSERINRLLHGMAADPSTAGAQFNESWMQPFMTTQKPTKKDIPALMKVRRACRAVGEAMEDACKAAAPARRRSSSSSADDCNASGSSAFQDIPVPVQQDLLLVYDSALRGEISWETWVSYMLESTAGIGGLETLGSKVQPWAAGKLWSLSTSVPTPGGRLYPHGPAANGSKVWLSHKLDGSAITYNMSSTTGAVQPMYTPSHFTQILNSTSAEMPLPFCAGQGCFDLVAQYAGNDATGKLFAGAGAKLQDVYRSAFSAKLPLAMVAASSSAFGGGNVVQAANAANNGCISMSTSVSNATDGKSYKTASNMMYPKKVNERSFQDIAGNSVHALVDGGFTDNTAVAWAVHAGATEITAVTTDIHGGGFPQLFEGAPGSKCAYLACPVYYQIFESPTFKEVQAQYELFAGIKPQFESRFLQSIKYGRITAKTRDNPWFGIHAGTEVTIHHLVINTKDLSIGGTDDYFFYSSLVQEIVTTIVSAADAKDLVKMFKQG